MPRNSGMPLYRHYEVVPCDSEFDGRSEGASFEDYARTTTLCGAGIVLDEEYLFDKHRFFWACACEERSDAVVGPCERSQYFERACQAYLRAQTYRFWTNDGCEERR